MREQVRNRTSRVRDSAAQARIDGLSTGSVRLQVTRIGYQPADTTISIDAAGYPITVVLEPGSVPLEQVSATAVPDSTFVGSDSIDWHAQGQVLRNSVRLQIQRTGDGFSILWHPESGRPLNASFVVTQRSPLNIRIAIREGVITGRWEALSGGSGRLTGRKEG